MTKIALALIVSVFLAPTASLADAKKDDPAKKEEKAPAKKEKACIDKVKDGKPVLGKDGKPEQVCKEVKVHEKLDGHKVPDKK
jgi:hypothetical protein